MTEHSGDTATIDPPVPAASAAPPPEPAGHGIDEVKQLGLIAGIASLGYVFWVVGAMEMVERLAYYGVKAVATLYAKDPVSNGGLGITMSEFGNILAVWALVQAFLPAVTGGLSDRYGYKQTIFISTVVKIMGYLTMAFFPTYNGFFAGAVLLATGTAIFKPGIQGTLAKATRRENSSLAWGIFYQTVNIGGFIGPLLASSMRKLEWQNVFFANAAVICLNFLLLLTYKEPGAAERKARTESKKESIWKESIRELRRPVVWVYLLVFSGFWFMFNALFDVLPAHIDDWVYTGDVMTTLFGPGGTDSSFIKFILATNAEGTQITPEGVLNVNAGLIMLTCFLFAHLSGKLRATSSMLIGTIFASAACFLSGWSMLGWISVGAIAIFSVGEMMSSPKFLEFIGNLAPSDKKAMYLGFSQIALAIGWTLEGKLGPMLYDHYASKDRFSRELLTERGMSAAEAAAVPQGEAFQKLVEVTGQTPAALTDAMLATHNVGVVWYIIGGIGLVSAVGIYLYGLWIQRMQKTA